MKKMLVILALSVSCAVFAVVFIQSQKQPKTISPLVSEEKDVEVTEKPIPLAKFDSESGFSFEYPGDLELDNLALPNEDSYANIQLTSKKSTGSTEISVTDTNEKSVQSYAKNNQINLDEASPVSFAEIKGQQISTKNQLITIALDQGILFKITTDLDQNPKYWTGIHSDILSTFKFTETVQPKSTTNTTQTEYINQSDEVEFTEEEDLSE